MILSVHVDSAQKLYLARIELASTAEPIAAVRSALDHYTIVALHALQTYAICVTCGLIRKHIYFYSIWDI